MIDPKLEGKVALVTGANHGIGAATALALAAQGARVFITFYRAETPYSKQELENALQERIGGPVLYSALQQQSADHVLDSINSIGGAAVAEELDLGEPENIDPLFALCEKKLGPVDILINNHAHCVLETFDPECATNEGYPIFITNTESIDRHFAVNARASALMMQRYLTGHIDRKADWGRVISLTTALIHPLNISYAASKRALVSYTLSAAQEMGKYGITANIVCPGATQTGYITPGSELERKCISRTPLNRLGLPEDVADVIVFLASEQAHWLTGQLIFASGGFSMFMRE